MLRDMLASATEQHNGHLVLSAKGYQEGREMFAHFAVDENLLAQLQRAPSFSGYSPRLRGFCLVSRRQGTQPAELLGVEPQRETEVSTFAQHLIAGSYLPMATGDTADSSALIGRGLAQKLGAELGSELVFVTQAADGSIGNDQLRVCGRMSTCSAKCFGCAGWCARELKISTAR